MKCYVVISKTARPHREMDQWVNLPWLIRTSPLIVFERQELSLEHLRVLVIDDSITIRAMIEQLVNREPNSRVIGSAADVPTAKRLLDDLHPNVITLDLAMPGVGGIDLLDYLRDRIHAPVVVLSSATTAAAPASLEALAHGASACFDKANVISDAKGFIATLKAAVTERVRRTGG